MVVYKKVKKMPPNVHIRYVAAVLTVFLIVLATCFGWWYLGTPSKMQTCTESDIPGVYVIKSDLERETSPNVLSEDLAALVRSNSAFACDLYQKICSDNGNLFFSPYSISVALAMTYAGARGETEQQMAEVLHFMLSQEQLHAAFNALDLALASEGNENFRLDIANALWGQVGWYFRSDFLDRLATNYGAGMWLVDFIKDAEMARIKINEWVSEHTENKIENLLPPEAVDDLTRLVLTNAIYFNASWLFPFSESRTEDGAFTLLNNSEVIVPMMSREASFRYAEGEGYKAVELPYSDQNTSMFIILPTLESFNEFETTLNAERVSEIVGNLVSTEVNLKMPKFEFEKSLPLSQVLPEMGMSAAFDPFGADFSGIDDDRDLYITDVLHKAFISVDENGTEAAAATAVVIGVTGMPPTPIEMSIDHPFIFMIRNNSTGTILFFGRVLDPTA
jgi:serpin B